MKRCEICRKPAPEILCGGCFKDLKVKFALRHGMTIEDATKDPKTLEEELDWIKKNEMP